MRFSLVALDSWAAPFNDGGEVATWPEDGWQGSALHHCLPELSDECALAKFAERAQKRLHDKAVTPSELWYGSGRNDRRSHGGRCVVDRSHGTCLDSVCCRPSYLDWSGVERRREQLVVFLRYVWC